MADGIQLRATIQIHPGKLEQFKQLAAQALAVVREKDPGTRQYDWYLNEDETVCVVRESYADAAAIVAHGANVGAILRQMGEISSMQLEVFGDVPQPLRDGLARLNPSYYGFLQGL